MEPTVELTSETEGNFLTPVTEQFTKEPFNLDELISSSNFKANQIQSLIDQTLPIQAEKDEIDAKIAKAKAAGAKTADEVQASKEVLPPTPVEEVPTTSIDDQVL